MPPAEPLTEGFPTPERESVWTQLVNGIAEFGGLPVALLLFVPRCCISFLVIGVAMACRAVARLVQTASGYQRKANLRILIITDYMPPQTHGIAIRFRQYIDYMRKEGHEVHVFCTNIKRETESSFDHPNLPSIVNPFNVKNMIAYSSGIKLAWYLGAKQWDIVHLVMPSNIPWAVLPVVAWRRIPIYVSHHVDMFYYVYAYVKLKLLADFGYTMYQFIMILPTAWLAQVNAAPTLTFLNEHLQWINQRCARKRIPSGVAHERFLVENQEQLVGERASLLAKCGLRGGGAKDDPCVILMVQRLAPEKGTMRCLEALAEIPRVAGKPLSLDGQRPLHLLIAGDGPSRKTLESYGKQHDLPITFAGNLPNTDLPPLYRAADIFVTCSTSETYGLTVLEALACGTPAVLPHCGVFDELWIGRIPNEWIYDEGTEVCHASRATPHTHTPRTRTVLSSHTARSTSLVCAQGALLAAMQNAGQRKSKTTLAKHPIKASWKDATHELLEQYEETIVANLPKRQNLASIISNLDSLLRAALVTLAAYALMRAYMGKMLKVAFKAIGVVDDLFGDD